jgi:NitT/TauT family transport system substrate-binding protein
LGRNNFVIKKILLGRYLLILIAFNMLPGLISGCSPRLKTNAAPVKLALLPILDTIPIYLAQESGYFAQEGINVEFIPVGSAAERDQVMAANQADGMVNDLVSVVLFNRKESSVQAIRYMRVATKDQPLYRIVAAKNSGIQDVKGLAGVSIGISQGSIIDYVTDQLLLAEGLTEDQIKTIAVPKIPERMALLGSGELKAATLPEPFATLAIQQGAREITNDTSHPEYGNSVISFRKTFLDAQPDKVKGFLKALEKAVQDINANPEKGRLILSKYKLVAPDLAASYPIPLFPTSSIPGQALFDAVASWAKGRGLVDRIVPYSDSVNSGFVVRPE